MPKPKTLHAGDKQVSNIDYYAILNQTNPLDKLASIYKYFEFKQDSRNKDIWLIIILKEAPFDLFKDIAIVISLHKDAIFSRVAYANDTGTAVDEVYITLPTDKEPEFYSFFGREYEYTNVIYRKLDSYTHFKYNTECISQYNYRKGFNGMKKELISEAGVDLDEETKDEIRRSYHKEKKIIDKDDIIDENYDF